MFGDNEDDENDIVVQSAAEEAALAEEQARIDDNGELEMENEGNNGDHYDNDSDDGEEIDDNPEVRNFEIDSTVITKIKNIRLFEPTALAKQLDIKKCLNPHPHPK